MSEVLSLEEKVLEAQEFIRANLSDSSIPTAMMFSGGKDSVVVRHLLESCGINHVDYWYSSSGIEGPYLKNYLLKEYPDVKWINPPQDLISEWKSRKYLPYPPRISKYDGNTFSTKSIKEYYCCYQIRFRLKAITLRPYTNIIMGVRSTDFSNIQRYEKQIVSHQGKSYFQPVYNFSRDDIYNYIEKYDIKLCKEYEVFGSTRTCPVCPIANAKLNASKIKEYTEVTKKIKDAAKYCYDNNPYIQEQFDSAEEYFDCFADKNKFRKKVYEEDKYFIDPETGLKYSNETGSVVM